MDIRDPAEIDRLIFFSLQACKESAALIATARELIAESKAMIQRHAIGDTPRIDASCSIRAAGDGAHP